jgi:hypothetical protein
MNSVFSKRAAAVVDVVDLCDDDTSFFVHPHVARLPDSPGPEVSLLNDDDDDVYLYSRADRKRRRRAEQVVLQLSESLIGKSDPNDDAIEVLDESQSNVDTFDMNTIFNISDDASLEMKVSPQNQVLEVFPDADINFVVKQLQKHGDSESGAQAVIASMADTSYPKISTSRRKPPPGHSMVRNPSRAVWKFDYMSSASFVPSAIYCSQVIERLTQTFPFLSKTGA